MNYIAIISVLVVIIIFLLYISTSNKGWNCTENGCVYVSGGSFGSYDKCNSYCKNNINTLSNNSNSSCDNSNSSYDNSSCGNYNSSCDVNPMLQPAYPNPFPYAPMGYGYYHPSLYHHDNHWGGGGREKHHHHHKDSGKIKNHNENNIVINSSPTGPN